VSPTYLCRVESGEPRIMESDKCSAIGWFDPYDVPDQLSQISRVNLVHYRERLRNGRY
jgi:hypothetical protein